MKKHLPLIAILIISFIAILSIMQNAYHKKVADIRLLPILGNKIIYDLDTTYHTVEGFSFINQLGDTISHADVKDKNYVVEYFFTTCESICPIMNKNMMKVALAYDSDTTFKILSHTVKPEEDTVASLLEYAKEHNANPKNWWFLTGDKKALYHLARNSYLFNGSEGDGGTADFIHTQFFILVDKQKHIRGFYDGTDSVDVDKLISDIGLLKSEQKANAEKH
jgi:protein SCO1/2